MVPDPQNRPLDRVSAPCPPYSALPWQQEGNIVASEDIQLQVVSQTTAPPSEQQGNLCRSITVACGNIGLAFHHFISTPSDLIKK